MKKKVMKAAKQRRKYQRGGSAFQRAAERRELNKTTPNTTQEQSWYRPNDNTDSVDTSEPKDRDIPDTTNTTDTGSNTDSGSDDASVDPTVRQQRIDATAARAEKLATGDIEGSGITLPSADVVKTGVDAEGQPLTNLETGTTEIETIADRTATTQPADITAGDISVTQGTLEKASLPSDFSLEKLNNDLSSGVSRRVGKNFKAVKNADGTYSFAAFNRVGKQIGTYRNKKYATPEQMVADAGLRYDSYVGLPGAAQVDAVKAGAVGKTTAASGTVGTTPTATTASLTEAVTAERDDLQEAAAAGTAASLPVRLEDYASAVSDEKDYEGTFDRDW